MDYSHEVKTSTNATRTTMSLLTSFKSPSIVYKLLEPFTMNLTVIRFFFYKPLQDAHRATYFLTAFCRTHGGQHTSLLPSVDSTEGNILPYCPLWNPRRATYFYTALCGTHRRQHTSLLPSVEPTEGNIPLYCPLWNPQRATYFLTALCGTHRGQHTSLLPSVEPTEGNILSCCRKGNCQAD
jgi:hypothetical protein